MSTGGEGPGQVGSTEDGGGEEDVGHHVGDPSSSRRRSTEVVWPEQFVEDLAVRVAVDACNTGGRLAAAPAVAVLFQVCSMWRNVSRSELLWQRMTMQVWGRSHTRLPSWQDEFFRRHLTAANFHSQRFTRSHLISSPQSRTLSCSRIALSDNFLAAGFLDGTVRLFDLPNGRLLATYLPDPHRVRIGRFSRAVSGLVFLPNDSDPDQLVFSFQDGDIHVAPLDGDPISGVYRLARGGNVVDDGMLIDFTADHRWWVGLFVGAPGKSWQLWGAETEELVYIGGTFTDDYAVNGWHLLTGPEIDAIGRILFAAPGMVIGCTRRSLQVISLTVAGEFLVDVDEEVVQENDLSGMDACRGLALHVDLHGAARVLRVPELEEVCRFNMRSMPSSRNYKSERERQMWEVVNAGCINSGYVILWTREGLARVWDTSNGEYIYAISEAIGVATTVAASERYIVVWTVLSGLHLWDFAPIL